MNRYVSVDSGKYATKVAYLVGPATAEKPHIETFTYCTKISEGNMDDDAIEKGTFVCQFDDDENVYKLGNRALKEASLETSKTDLTHKYCTMLALARIAGLREDEDKDEPSDCIDEMHVAIGIPVSLYSNVKERLAYKEFILGKEGEVHTVRYRSQTSGDVIEKKFKIVSRRVYPESAGAVYMDITRNYSQCYVIDIGNLNCNLAPYAKGEVEEEESITEELGGAILRRNLATKLSAEFNTRVDEKLVGRILKEDPDNRCLKPCQPNEDIERRSKKIIHDFLLDHCRQIKNLADAAHWPIAFAPLTFIGGTAKVLRDSLYEVFGKSICIPKNPELSNAYGFLVRLIAWELKTNIDISYLDEVSEAA